MMPILRNYAGFSCVNEFVVVDLFVVICRDGSERAVSDQSGYHGVKRIFGPDIYIYIYIGGKAL